MDVAAGARRRPAGGRFKDQRRSNVVIMRETQVLAALAGTDVPHPHLIASCADPGVLGDAVFYLMEPIDGFNAGEGLPELHSGDPAVRFQMGLSMADALAKLGAVDYVAVGLERVGHVLAQRAAVDGHRAAVDEAGG